MKTFLARQPILSSEKEITSYELLFRSSEENQANVVDGYQATMKVIKDLIINFGVKEIVNGKRFFINFNEDLILEGAPDLFKPEDLVIELLEDTVDSDEIILKLKNYKERGYLIALDDFIYTDNKKHLCELADIIKLDFMISTQEELKRYSEQLNPFKVILLGEKIETKEEYDFAKSIGCTMFQGYFFHKPTVLESSEAMVIPGVYLELIDELNKTETDFRKLESIVKRDNQLVVSLLKLLNSAAYYSNHRVTSIRQALVTLGVKGSKNLFLTNMLRNMNQAGAPSTLISKSLKRGKLAELLAEDFNMKVQEDELFLVGILSLINIILNKPMRDILKDLPLHDDIIYALLGQENQYSRVIELIIMHELDMVDDMVRALDERGISVEQFNTYYLQANKWSDEIWNALDSST